MSGAVKQRGAAPPAPSKMPPPDAAKMGASNGNGAHFGTLSYPSEMSDDVNMNQVDGPVTLNVTLPNGQKTDITIDYNTPMLDLLVSLAGKSRLNPSGLSLQLISEDTGKPVAYKANQTIGALGGRVVHVVNKADSLGKDKTKSMKKKQPFEMTHRFTMNLPRGQKAVSRVSPLTTLGELMMSVCRDKGLDPQRHVLQHPGRPGVAVDPRATVGQLGVFEVNLVNLAHQDKRNQALSMPDLSQVPTARDDKIPSYMPSAGETKKKKGFFSFLRKERKFNPNDTLYNVETSSTTSHMMSAAQARKMPHPANARRGSDTGLEHTRPKSMFVTSPVPSETENFKPSPKENVQSQVTAPARKKRKAPAPPVPQHVQNTTQNNENKMQDGKLHKLQTSDTSQASPQNKENEINTEHVSQPTSRAEMLSRLHSRNSSDSSGYHELTLSGCESPEASHGILKSKLNTDSTSIESADHANGDSGIHESPIRVSPIEEVLERSDSVAVVASAPPPSDPESLPKAATLPSTKRKKAPAPPPISVPQPEPSPVSSKEVNKLEVANTKSDVEDVGLSVDVPDNVVKPADDLESTHVPVVDKDDHELLPVPETDDYMDEDTGFDIDDILSTVKFDEEAAPFKPIVMPTLESSAGDDSMMMVETASVSSENIDQIDVLSKSERPCAFVPPPPPTEPPPPDEPEVDFDYHNGSVKPVFVDKGTGVNEDNASLAPSSAKNSPEIAQHRRMDSYSSVGSIDTIEGISLDFQMAIEMGEETLSPSLDDVEGKDIARDHIALPKGSCELIGRRRRRRSEVSPDGFKTEMALFVERMSKMAVDTSQTDSNNLNDSLSSGMSVPGSESNSDTGSVIRHLRNDSRDSKSGSESGSLRNKEFKSIAVSEQRMLSSVNQSEETQGQTNLAISEEITIPVETVPPPPEFDDNEVEGNNDSDSDEIIETLEEIIIPLGPNGYDFTSAKKISEVTTVVSKEPKWEPKPKDGVFRAEPVSITPSEPVSIAAVNEPKSVTHMAKPVSITPVTESEPISSPRSAESYHFTPVYATIVQPQQHPHQSEPVEKEEFVLTTEDLSNVTFLPPKVKSAPPSAKVLEPDHHMTSTTLIMSKSPHKPYLNADKEEQVKNDTFTQDIQSRVSQLSFTPRPESETDSVLEEKPITLLNMPPMKVAIESDPVSNGLSKDTRNDAYSNLQGNSKPISQYGMADPHDQDYTDSAVYISESAPDAVEYYEERPESRASATSFDLTDQQEGLQTQYNALQMQFTQWQEQLLQNQSLLSADNPSDLQAEQLQQLSSQMAMQQEMMMQLQSTMQAVQIQQQQLNGRREHKASGNEMEQAAAAAESAFRSPTPPPPPPPPAAPSIVAGDVFRSVQLKPVKASKPKSDPRFERQLDPREELMIAIRDFNGREKLRSVPAKETKWIHSSR